MSSAPAPNAAIAELVTCLGTQDAQELVRMFLKSFEISLGSLDAASQEEKRRIVHGVKSSSRIIGVMPLSRCMRELEERVAEGGAILPNDMVQARKLFSDARPTLVAFAGEPAI